MGVFKRALCALPLAVALVASPASATVVEYYFTIQGGAWSGAGASPYGMDLNSPIQGFASLDNTKTGKDAFLDLQLQTGSRVWILSDLNPTGTEAQFFWNGSPLYIGLTFFDAGNYVSAPPYVGSTSSARFQDGDNWRACDGCVQHQQISAIPEPGVWALMIAGFGLTGAALRRRRAVTA